ncbi:MAG: hypothetical protein ACO1OG_03195 [Devosia sp.]
MQGITALVVEEEYLIAADIEQSLLAAGVGEVQVVTDISELIETPVAVDRFQLAILEARLGDPEVVAFAAHLRRLGVAVVVTSADTAIQGLFEGASGLGKPFDTAGLIAACEAALSK